MSLFVKDVAGFGKRLAKQRINSQRLWMDLNGYERSWNSGIKFLSALFFCHTGIVFRLRRTSL